MFNLCYVPFKEKKWKKNKFYAISELLPFAGRGSEQKNSKFNQLTAIEMIKGKKKHKNVHSFNMWIMQKRLSWNYSGPIVCEWPLYHPKNSLDFKRSFSYFYRSKQVTKKKSYKRNVNFSLLDAASLDFSCKPRARERERKNPIKRCFYCVNPSRKIRLCLTEE